MTKMLALTRHTLLKIFGDPLTTNSSRILKTHKLCRCQQILEISTTTSVWRKSKKVKLHDLKKKEEAAPVVPVWKNITVMQVSKALNRKVDDILEILLYIPNTNSYGMPSSEIDDVQVLKELAKKLGHRIRVTAPPQVAVPVGEELYKADKDVTSMPIRKADLAPRPPIVTIMGHVDHGKTTLLDSLRNSNIVAGEAGGITQAIGAFQVKLDDRLVTFIDTPGHAAFSAMRNRGAQATDIVVLVVAADDGVMDQTRESIMMAKDADVPIIVAINKIDRHEADIERTKKMLLQEGIQLEDFGGDVMSVPISALKATNLTALVEAIITQAELMQLRGEQKGMVEGVVLESRVDMGRGKISSGVIQRGVLRKSSIIVAGTAWAKVRSMFDEHGQILTTAGPSTPVEIIGWRDLPSAGDKIFEVESETRAKEVVSYRKTLKATEKQIKDASVIKEKMTEWQIAYQAQLEYKRKMGYYKLRRKGPREKENKEDTSGIPKLSVVVKGDVDGSVESFLDVLDSYDCDNQCRVDVIHYGVGDVTESDVKLAQAFKAHIYGFNVKLPDRLVEMCIRSGVEFRQSRIIYRLVEALKKDIEAILPTLPRDEIIGEANVLQVFMVTEGKKKIPVAGSKCVKGTLNKDSLFRLIRGEDTILFDGPLHSMRIVKKDVASVPKDAECGLGLGLGDVEVIPQIGDRIVCYKINQLKQKTEWAPIGF